LAQERRVLPVDRYLEKPKIEENRPKYLGYNLKK
jgi:hypothetical protein